MIYFVQTQGGGRIKIGHSSSFKRRLEGIRCSNAYPIDVLYVTEGGLEGESYLHRKLAEHRVHLEWFEPHDDVFAVIDALKSGEMKLEPEPSFDNSQRNERDALMVSLAEKAGHEGVSLLQLFKNAGLSATILHNWRSKATCPSISTIGKLERALDRMGETK